MENGEEGRKKNHTKKLDYKKTISEMLKKRKEEGEVVAYTFNL